METEQLKVGDRVKIVTYGELKLDYNRTLGIESQDIKPYLVGKVGTIDAIVGKKYYVKGISAKYGPYNWEQLEKL